LTRFWRSDPFDALSLAQGKLRFARASQNSQLIWQPPDATREIQETVQ
jgi:hypothetical protein